ncbi:actin-related protein 8-like [Telopea speciosissima]|uniref:actin-related protein 8-like n=1 Tax=Telopea speciosissima TaxID=54955 RepID=UPI001CC3415B|nr:actin-related protein 8-like [Telopea speciosissima]
MATLLRRVWESISCRSNSNWNSSGTEWPIVVESSTGAFDQIPSDIFIQILKFLGPKEAARLSLVCKSWKLLVSDNRLWIFFLQNQQESWDAIVFAETNLRSGYPPKTFCHQLTQISFMNVYAQRAKVTGSVIIDGEFLLLYLCKLDHYLGEMIQFYFSISLFRGYIDSTWSSLLLVCCFLKYKVQVTM